MKKYIWLIVIVLIAAALRFYQLGINPPSLTWDEVSWGYNAYSLGIDGKDEFGRFLPFDYPESFGDFKPPMYAYLSVLPVKIFGLNEFATRFSSAFFGILTVLITYFLVKEIFKKAVNSETIALVTSGILAISPWHIMLSRAAFEANIATFFIVSGMWLFFSGVQQEKQERWKKICLPLAILSFVLSMYTFNTARVVVPLLGVVLLIGFWRKLLVFKKQTIIAGIIGLALLLPLVPFLLSPQAQLRYREVNIFTDLSIIERTNRQIDNDHNVWWSKVIHNRRFAYGVEFLRHYFDNLNPSFLFIKGDGNPKFSTQDVGELYLWELPFFIGGVLLLIRKREGNWWMIPVWLLIGIIPAATARETPHALRIETTLPTFQILVAYGIINIKNEISKIKYGIARVRVYYLLIALSLIFLIFNFSYFIHGYYAHYPTRYASEWQYGYKQAIEYVKDREAEYDQIYVTKDLGRPYAYLLFFLKTPPEEFRRTADITREVYGFVHVEGFGKYKFASKLHDKKPSGKILYVNTTSNVPENAQILKTIHLPDGLPVLEIYTL